VTGYTEAGALASKEIDWKMFSRLLRGGDAADEVFLLGLGFGADSEGVEEIEAESEVEGFILAGAEFALAEDFHADDAFAGGAHLANDADDGIRIGIHIGAHGVDSNEVDFDPGRFCGGAKRFEAVAGAAVSTNDAFFLGFGEDVHHAFVAIGPIAFGEAVHEADIKVVGAEFAAKAVEVGAGGGGVASPSLCENGDFVAGDMLEGFGDVRVTAVRVGAVEKTQAMVVAVEEQVGETFDAEGGLMRMMAGTDRASAHGEAACLYAGLAERDGVRSAEFSRERCESKRASREGGGMEREGTGCASSAMEEFAAFHGASQLRRSGGSLPLMKFGRAKRVMGYQANG